MQDVVQLLAIAGAVIFQFPPLALPAHLFLSVGFYFILRSLFLGSSLKRSFVGVFIAVNLRILHSMSFFLLGVEFIQFLPSLLCLRSPSGEHPRGLEVQSLNAILLTALRVYRAVTSLLRCIRANVVVI